MKMNGTISEENSKINKTGREPPNFRTGRQGGGVDTQRPLALLLIRLFTFHSQISYFLLQIFKVNYVFRLKLRLVQLTRRLLKLTFCDI